jgi:hypothetical protein
MKNISYDYIVIGSGLSGLSVATALAKETSSVLLIEGNDVLGGQNYNQTKYENFPNVGLRFLPHSDLSQKAIGFLSQLIQEPTHFEQLENQPQTFEAGNFKPFVGFGQNSPEFYEAFSFLFSKHELLPNLPITNWVEKLVAAYKGEIALRSWVTHIKVEEGRATTLTINGQKTISAMNVVYAGKLQALPALLPLDAINARARQKLSKGPYCTAVELSLYFNKAITEKNNLHVLYGSSSEELKPCFGRFSNSISNESDMTQPVQASNWLTLVDFEEAEDNEIVGEALKRMKRQIKRAYPEAFDSIAFEKIHISSGWHGTGDLKLSSNQSLPLVNNLWVASGSLSSQAQTIGALLQAELVLSAMGAHPGGTAIELNQDLDLDPTLDLN